MNSTTKAMEFETTPISKPNKEGVKRIQNKAMRRAFRDMSDLRVLWLVASHLGYKRRVGLLIFVLVAYFALDHSAGLSNVVQIIQGTLFGSF